MASSLQVVGVVSFYMVAALVMVFVNKLVLNANPNLPILFMFFQSITTVILLKITSMFTSHIQIPEIKWSTAKKLLPLLVVDAAGFTFNALCLRDVEAAFYQIARGMVLPLTITVVAINTRKTPSAKVVVCAAIVCFGFFIGVTRQVLPEHAVPTPLALFYGFLSSLAIAIHAVLIKNSLPHVGGSPTKLSFWTNTGSAFLLGSLALARGEVFDFQRMATSGNWDWTTFAYGNVITGIFGFLISVAGILSVKVTSPVTHMFSSAARSVIQIALGVHFFGDVMTRQRLLSAFTILTGTLIYTYIKSTEQTPTPPSTSSQDLDLESQQVKQPLMEEIKDEEMDLDAQIAELEGEPKSADSRRSSRTMFDADLETEKVRSP